MITSLAARRATVVTAASAASPTTTRRCAVSPLRTTPIVAAAVVGRNKPLISPLAQVRKRRHWRLIYRASDA